MVQEVHRKRWLKWIAQSRRGCCYWSCNDGSIYVWLSGWGYRYSALWSWRRETKIWTHFQGGFQAVDGNNHERFFVKERKYYVIDRIFGVKVQWRGQIFWELNYDEQQIVFRSSRLTWARTSLRQRQTLKKSKGWKFESNKRKQNEQQIVKDTSKQRYRISKKRKNCRKESENAIIRSKLRNIGGN